MGKHFGNLARVRHVITYSLSPFEQRAIPNVFSHGVPNVMRRFSSQVLKVVPPLAVGYLIYSWGMQEFERLKRKNPADYEHDQ
ncbi:cytochrome b-c1 complex subunit 8 [Myiozetetes cayanensis]|uniref:cytochrome b-c1 complex subunit 8 n=1 Tax=Empidonax traillii TaxID=164674 RepID=UPI000FFD90A6|nr:cytochrome b-c1 complex subunit 8 [Empidonax traillii]XP_050168237.1 cytochrome b-c1 complex subunit 8 [Myiozetetes cayanensis]